MKVKFQGREKYNAIAKRILAELENPRSEYTKGMYEIAVDGVIKRTRSGVDVAGMKFKPYSKEYAKRKGRQWANLTDSGKLMSHAGFEFQVMRGQNKVVIRIYIPGQHHSGDIDHYTLGYTHNFGMGHAPQREFMGLDQKITDALMAFSKEKWRELFNLLK
jgi:phage gpG-like protein